MKALFYTREYPPYVYGGAGVHVEYLAAELAKLIEVEVRSFGDQNETAGNLVVKGFPFDNPVFDQANDKLKAVLKTLSTCIQMNAEDTDADVVHCHTWYAHFAGIIAKLCYGIPLVITTHSLEPLRPWKREQLGRGYDASSWVEKTAIEMADAIIAVSKETKEDVLKFFDVEEDKVKVIYNGIDLQQYTPTEDTSTLREYGVDPAKPFVLFVGRITRQKGIIHLVNAIKYTPDGGTIHVSGVVHYANGQRQIADKVEILVRDSGIGIDPDMHELIFSKFYQTGEVALHSSAKTQFKGGGPGLGLAITRGIVEAHGGKIWLESPGHDEKACPGTTFHVLLPIMQQQPA